MNDGKPPQQDEPAQHEEPQVPARQEPTQPVARPNQDEPSGLLNTAIQRPVTVIACMILVAFFGFLAVQQLPIQLTPDIERPTITVRTVWPGAAPVEVETDIIERQERVLRNVQGLTRMESSSRTNLGEITLEFEVGTNIDEAVVRVSNQLTQVPGYPENVDNPVVQTANATGPPLAVIIASRVDGGSMGPYRTWMEETILPQFERIRGVAGSFMRGGQVDEVHIDFQPEALAARGITVGQLAARVQSELSNVSAGDIQVGKRRLLVRTMLAAEVADQMGRTVLAAAPDGTPIRVQDVATVSRSLRKPEDVALINDRPGIAMLFFRESGTNVLDVTDQIRELVDRLDEEVFQPEGLRLQLISEQSGYIRDSLRQVRNNLLLGAGFAIIVLLVFLRSFGASAIISLAIPLCALGTALGMGLLGRSINVVSLAGVTFAIGMVVDASIVALENIDTWRGREPDGRRSSFFAIREVWGALLASTATTVVVFVPIIAWQGEVGEILRDIAYSISIAVTLSFLVSVLVIPSLASWLLGRRRGVAPADAAAAAAEGVAVPRTLGQRVIDGVAGQARWLSASAWRALLVVVAACALATFVATALLPKMDYLPAGNRNLVFGILLPPPGYSVEEVDKIGRYIQDRMVYHQGEARDGMVAIDRAFFVGDPSQIFAGGVAVHNDDVVQMRDFMRGLYTTVPGNIAFASQASLFGSGIANGRAVEVELSGQDLTTLVGLGGQLFGQIMQGIPGAQIRPVPLLDLGAPELRVVPRRDQTAGFAPTGAELALTTSAYVDGAIIGEWGEEGSTKIDVVIRAVSERGGYAVTNQEELESAPVALANGSVVPFGVLARIETALGPTVIQRLERRRAVILQVTPPDDYPLEQAIEVIRDRIIAGMIESSTIPSGVDVTIGGTAGKLEVAQKQFAGILLVALIISFLLLAALFEDFIAPVVVLIVIPLAAAGGIIALRLVDVFLAPQPLDLISAIGFLILIGVVVNNAILIVDGALARLRAGEDLDTSVAEAVRGRVRPIFMSTMTSLAGLAPMVFITGEGSELYRGVGAIVLGGLALSTVLALYVVPAFFAFIWRIRFRLRGDAATS